MQPDLLLYIVFEIYNSKLLNSERLKFIIKKKCKHFKITSNLIKQLFIDDNFELINIRYFMILNYLIMTLL